MARNTNLNKSIEELESALLVLKASIEIGRLMFGENDPVWIAEHERYLKLENEVRVVIAAREQISNVN